MLNIFFINVGSNNVFISQIHISKLIMRDFFLKELNGDWLIYAGDGRHLTTTNKRTANILLPALNNMILIADPDRGFDRQVIAETFLDDIFDIL